MLWVCPTTARRDELRARAESLRSVAVFATAADALASPHGEIWLDHVGNKADLHRQKKEDTQGQTAAGTP